MVFSKSLFVALGSFASGVDVVLHEQSNSTVDSNFTEVQGDTANFTEVEEDTVNESALVDYVDGNHIHEFLDSADEDGDGKTTVSEINTMLQFDISEADMKKYFTGTNDPDMKFFLEQKSNMTTWLAEADSDKDGVITQEEAAASTGLRSFLQSDANADSETETETETDDALKSA